MGAGAEEVQRCVDGVRALTRNDRNALRQAERLIERQVGGLRESRESPQGEKSRRAHRVERMRRRSCNGDPARWLRESESATAV